MQKRIDEWGRRSSISNAGKLPTRPYGRAGTDLALVAVDGIEKGKSCLVAHWPLAARVEFATSAGSPSWRAVPTDRTCETERQERTMNWNAMTKAWLRARALMGSKSRAFYRAISEEWLAKFRLKAHYTNRRSLP